MSRSYIGRYIISHDSPRLPRVIRARDYNTLCLDVSIAVSKSEVWSVKSATLWSTHYTYIYSRSLEWVSTIILTSTRVGYSEVYILYTLPVLIARSIGMTKSYFVYINDSLYDTCYYTAESNRTRTYLRLVASLNTTPISHGLYKYLFVPTNDTARYIKTSICYHFALDL